MSAAEMRNLEDELALLSYAEQLAVIEYLVKRMRQQTENRADGFEGDKTARNGLDEAIAELERGDYDTYDNFDDFLAEVEHES